jgi:hypothetical protein
MTVCHPPISQHPTSDGSDILVRFDNTYYLEFQRRISHQLIHWSILWVIKRYHENQCVRSRTLDRISYETHHQWLTHIDSPTCTATQIDGHASISNRYRTLRGSFRLCRMRTCLSSFFSSENTLYSNHNFLIESIIICILSFSRRES